MQGKSIRIFMYAVIYTFLSGCSSTNIKSANSEDTTITVEIPIKKEFIYYRSNALQRTISLIDEIYSGLPKSDKQAAKIKANNAIMVQPEELRVQGELPDSQKAKLHENIQNALDKMAYTYSHAVYTHTNKWTHADIPATNQYSVKIRDLTRTHAYANIGFYKKWVWNKSSAHSHAKINLDIKFSETSNNFQIQMKILDIDMTTPRAGGIFNSVAEVNFNKDEFYKVLSKIPQYYETHYDTQDPYQQIVSEILKDARSKAETINVAQATELKRIQAAARAKRSSEVVAFRTALKEGSETNCGPVLEIKETLVRIYAPVKDFGNEHWLNVQTLYPPGYGCTWLNGQYQPPVAP